MTRMLVVVALMFGFGYAMVPLYRVFCDVTGINNLLGPDEIVGNTQVDLLRSVTVEFDANAHELPWDFRAEQSNVRVHPGELVHVRYRVHNRRDHPVMGQAIPSYGPQRAAQYFRKLECFCFDRQTLGPGEVREMPVVFVIDPALPSDVTTITLSYTFFEVAGSNASEATRSARPGA